MVNTPTSNPLEPARELMNEFNQDAQLLTFLGTHGKQAGLEAIGSKIGTVTRAVSIPLLVADKGYAAYGAAQQANGHAVTGIAGGFVGIMAGFEAGAMLGGGLGGLVGSSAGTATLPGVGTVSLGTIGASIGSFLGGMVGAFGGEKAVNRVARACFGDRVQHYFNDQLTQRHSYLSGEMAQLMAQAEATPGQPLPAHQEHRLLQYHLELQQLSTKILGVHAPASDPQTQAWRKQQIAALGADWERFSHYLAEHGGLDADHSMAPFMARAAAEGARQHQTSAHHSAAESTQVTTAHPKIAGHLVRTEISPEDHHPLDLAREALPASARHMVLDPMDAVKLPTSAPATRRTSPPHSAGIHY